MLSAPFLFCIRKSESLGGVMAELAGWTFWGGTDIPGDKVATMN